MAITNQLQQMNLENLEHAGASMYYLKSEGVKVYRYDVEISQIFFEKIKYLTRRSADDGQKILYRRLCDAIIRVVRDRCNFSAQSGGAKQPYVYDGKKNLYLLNLTDYVEHTFTVGKEEIDSKLGVYLSSDVTVKIQQSNNLELTLSTEQPDDSVRMFFELLTSQSFYNLNTYDVVNSGMIYDSRVVKNNVYMSTQLKSGFKKGVRFIRDKKAALVFDVVSSVFYPPITILDMYTSFKRQGRGRSDEEFVSFLRGVRGFLVHDPRRTVVFDGFSSEIMNNITLDTRKNGLVSFVDFYAKKKRPIHDVKMRAVRVESNKKEPTLFPPELFEILPYQRVPFQKTNADISTAMLSANSIKPTERYDKINDRVALLDNGFLSLFGVRVEKHPMIHEPTLAKRLKMPKYEMMNHQLIELKANCQEYSIKNQKFVSGATIKQWAVIAKDVEGLKSSLKQLQNTGNRFGMQIDEPKLCDLRDVSEKTLTESIKKLKNAGCKFVVLCDNKNEPTHDILKFLEQNLDILTQHISKDTLLSEKSRTLRNIILKMNMKNGGMNYIPVHPSPTDLNAQKMNLSNIFVFSYDVSHPAPATPQERNRLFAMDMANVKSLEPSVVGFAANMAKDPYNFIGDYFFQASRQESIDPVYLERAFRYSFSKAKENRNDRFNARLVFVIRDGISEGECQMAVNQELEVLRRVREKFLGANDESRFVFVMVNKRHGKRFFNIEGNRTDNLNKCSAIDTTVVRPDVTEFYLMSHTPIRGTAKIPQYLKLYDDVNMPQNVLEDFLHVMCHNHQISLGGVSIPAPVYLAHELAKRGRNNFLCAREKNLIDPGDVMVTAENRDFVRLSKNLGYRQNSINNLRFTA